MKLFFYIKVMDTYHVPHSATGDVSQALPWVPETAQYRTLHTRCSFLYIHTHETVYFIVTIRDNNEQQ